MTALRMESIVMAVLCFRVEKSRSWTAWHFYASESDVSIEERKLTGANGSGRLLTGLGRLHARCCWIQTNPQLGLVWRR
jgi:hypothetical protein